MEENHAMLQENIPELKDMSFQTENVQSTQHDGYKQTHPKAKH